MAKKYYTVASADLYKTILEPNLFGKGLVRENPFFIDTFPRMVDISYSVWTKRGTLYVWRAGDDERYNALLEAYKEGRYSPDTTRGKINMKESVTQPKVYNIATGDKIKAVIGAFLGENTKLVIKKVDLGAIYAKHMYDDRSDGDRDLHEVYNEIRVGFFLNELLYAYPEVVTSHFMVVVDWFVSDTNLYPNDPGHGPFQYIVSEELSRDFLTHHVEHDLATLRCSLFSIAHALEVAWKTHEFVHYDLHSGNVMMKAVQPNQEKMDYLYTRPGGDDNTVYVLPTKGTHNFVVKILDFGRCHMRIPVPPDCCGDEKRDLFEHIDGQQHQHDSLIFFYKGDKRYTLGEKVVEPDRTWDLRRLFFDIVTALPLEFWDRIILENDEADPLLLLEDQIIEFLPPEIFNHVTFKDSVFGGEKHESFVSKLIFSKVRDTYVRFQNDGIISTPYNVKTGQKELHFIDTFDSKAREINENPQKLRQNLLAYFEWYRYAIKLVRETVYKTKKTPTDFLNSAFFDPLRQTNVAYDDSKHVWMGKWPKDVNK